MIDEKTLTSLVFPIVKDILDAIPRLWEEVYLGYFLVDARPQSTNLVDGYESVLLLQQMASSPAIENILIANYEREEFRKVLKHAQDRFGEVYRFYKKAGEPWRRMYV